MIRIVAMRKAMLAGVLAALAWELALRPLLLAGLPAPDIVRTLGAIAAPDAPFWAWWPAGLVLHLLVGMIWAVFYAYFFWSVLKLAPLWQGVVFSFVPAALAIAVVYPQLQVMQAAGPVLRADALDLVADLSWREWSGVLVGHLIFGSVLGALYTHPIGYRAGSKPPTAARAHGKVSPAQGSPNGRDRGAAGFMFATGIECSYPTIEHGRWRRDQMAATGHYQNWRRDLELCVEVGVSHLRYGPPLHLILHARGQYDWTFVDSVLPAARALGIEPIVDLCHFGVPDWLENFQNPEIPDALSAYAGAFARRYPWIRFYTPVNEMYVCARLSALDGVWNEQRRDETSFVTAVRNLARASACMTDAILLERPDAVFVNSESGEFYQPASPDPKIVAFAEFENERRFLPLDLMYARAVSDGMRDYLRRHGMTDDDYAWFMRRKTGDRTILGVDYYEWNEKLVDASGRVQSLGELFGWYVIAMQYWERYRRPLMHSETNHLDARQAPRWIWRQWHNVQLIQRAGVPVLGFTWYSLTDQADWDIALSEPLGNINPVGLFDLNRRPRAVAQAYKHLIETFADVPQLSEYAPLKELLA